MRLRGAGRICGWLVLPNIVLHSGHLGRRDKAGRLVCGSVSGVVCVGSDGYGRKEREAHDCVDMSKASAVPTGGSSLDSCALWAPINTTSSHVCLFPVFCTCLNCPPAARPLSLTLARPRPPSPTPPTGPVPHHLGSQAWLRFPKHSWVRP